MLPDSAPAGIIDVNSKAVVLGTYLGPLVPLVLGDVHAILSVAAVVVALLFGRVVRGGALAGRFYVLVKEILAAPLPDPQPTLRRCESFLFPRYVAPKPTW